MLQKRTFKVLAPIAKQNGGHFWMRCGTAHTNKDDSINIYLDAVPKDLKFTLRELDADDLRKIEEARAAASGRQPALPTDAPPF